MYGIITFLAFFLIGSAQYVLFTESPLSKIDLSSPTTNIGIITHLKSKPQKTTYQIELESIHNQNGNHHKVRQNIDAHYSIADSCQYLKIGDRISFNEKIYPLKNMLNPEGFDFKKFKFYKGIQYQTFLKEFDLINHKSSFSSFISNNQIKIRCYMIDLLEDHIKDEHALAIATAMLLGYKDEMDKSLYTAFANTGAVHVLAVSGLHVGILSYCVFFLTSMFKHRGRFFMAIRLCICLLCIWSFAILTGGAPSVIRSAIMFSLFLIGKTNNQKSSFYNILAGTALIMLLFNPLYLFQIGFQFSFLAIWSIIFFYPYVSKLIEPKNKLGNYIWDLTSVSIAAQILVGPLSIYYFNKFPSIFIISGIIAIPAAFLIMINGMALIIAEFIIGCSLFTSFIASLLNLLLKFFYESIFFLHELPYSLIEGIHIENIMLITIYLSLISIMLFIKTKNSKMFISFLAMIFFANGYALSFQFELAHQKKLVVYHKKEGTQIDLFDGTIVYSFKLGASDPYFEDATKSFYSKNKIQRIIKLDLNDRFDDGILTLDNNIIKFEAQKILVISPETILKNDTEQIYNYALIINSTPPPILPYSNVLQSKWIIFDGSIDYHLHKKWMNYLEQHAYSGLIHYSKDKGAFIKKIENDEPIQRAIPIYKE